MKKPLDELKGYIDHILILLRENKKIMGRHKEWLCDIISTAINSKPLNERDFEVLRTMKEIEKKHLIKMPVFDVLNHQYILLADWVKLNQGFIVPLGDKVRIERIMKQINEFPEYTEEEISALHDKAYE